MSLYEVTHKDKEILASDLEKSVNEYLRHKKLDPRTFEKILRTLDTAISNLKPSKQNALVWTKAGALVGTTSPEPVRDINHLWEKLTNLFGESKTLLKFIGTLVMWRIVLREDTWLVYRRETDQIDEDSGKEIKICEYWIDNDYDFPYKKPTINDLVSKFNSNKNKNRNTKNKVV